MKPIKFQLIKTLIAFISIGCTADLQAQNTPFLYRATDNKTIIASTEAKIGAQYTLDGVEYLVVDDGLLKQMAKDRLDLSKTVTTRVTDMSFLCYKWTDFNQDISHWDVSQVSDFSWMFGFAETFNADLSAWDLNSAIILSDMFHGTKSFQGDLSSWDVSGVTMFNGMFHNSNFNQPLNNWNLKNAENTSGMFDDNLYFNQPLDRWDMSQVAYMGGMFAEAIAFDQDLSMWNTCSVQDMTNMFRNATAFRSDLSGWCVTGIKERPIDFGEPGAFKEPQWGKEKTKKYSYWMIYGMGLLIVGGLGAAWLLKKRKKSTSKISLAQALVDRAKLLGRADLSRAELDEVFGIDKSAFEAQKVYRSRILKELGRQHPDLLRRERDPNDKRSYRYIIHHPDLSNRQNQVVTHV